MKARRKAKKKSKTVSSKRASKYYHLNLNVTEADLTRGLSENLLDAWKKLRAFGETLGVQRIYASHNSIMFSRKVCYFFVRPKKSFLEVWIFLPRKVDGLKSMRGTACMASGSKDPNYLQCFLQRRITMLTNEPRSRGYKKLAIISGTIASVIIGLVAYGSEIIVRDHNAPPNPGVVKFDPDIQKIASEELDKALKKSNAKGGTVVVAEPQTGRILAVADMGPAQNPDYTGLSRRFQIASIGKMMVTAYAVEKGLTDENEKLYCEHGSYKFGDHVYEDYKAFDFLTTQQTIALSSNICTIKIGQRLGADGVESAIRNFGFGQGGSASEFPTARSGIVPHANELSEPDYIASISTGMAGYDSGYVVTPLEITQAFGAVANGGNLMKPVGIGEAPVVMRRILSEATAKKMRDILQAVVTEGTGHSKAESKLYTTAGKTASNPEKPESNNGQAGAASFVGFAPVSSPKVLVFVTVRDTGDMHPVGGFHAAPVFREVADRVLKLMNVPPDKK